ncbi:MAG: hypothetical protein K6F53_01725 [Lachnospiraceae bacterium]|nr:hypothetical protein [Lachnospiraceae bacterium]
MTVKNNGADVDRHQGEPVTPGDIVPAKNGGTRMIAPYGFSNSTKRGTAGFKVKGTNDYAGLITGKYPIIARLLGW